jgi:hypothetical protein
LYREIVGKFPDDRDARERPEALSAPPGKASTP